MSWVLLLGAGFVVATLAEIHRRRRRAAQVSELGELARSLAILLFLQGETDTSLEGFEEGALVIRLGERTLRIPALDALEIHREPEPERSRRLQHLVDRERIRQGV